MQLVRESQEAESARGQTPALHGAKITGGGCGGTVCVMGSRDEAGEAALEAVVKQYAKETGHVPHVFRGSSMGATQFGHLKMRRRSAAGSPTAPDTLSTDK